MALALCLRQADEILAAVEKTLAIWSGPVPSDEATIGIARDAQVYTMLLALNEAVATNVLGDQQAFNALLWVGDQSQPDSFAALMRTGWTNTRKTAVVLFMRTFHVTQIESQRLSEGRISIADLFVLIIAALNRVVLYVNNDQPPQYSTAFQCVRRHALVATEEQSTNAIEQLSARQTMLALHAVYSSTACIPYTPELEQYTGLLMRRALELLLTPADEDTWDNLDYRAALGTGDQFRYSTMFLRDVCIVYYALSDLFDLAHLVELDFDPYTLCPLPDDALARTRRWFERFAHREPNLWVRDKMVQLALYAGEEILYHREHRGQHANTPLIIKEHRKMDFYHLTEQAPLASSVIIAREIGHVETSLHMSLIVLVTLKARIRSAQPVLDPNLFVLLQPEMRQWTCLMTTQPLRPMLVLFFSRVQLYYNHRLWMYNDAFQALYAWMSVVEQRCLRKLEGFDVGMLIDEFFRPDESAQQRIARMGVLQGETPPMLGAGGLY